MENTSQKRLDYLDMVKGIGIFFVVLGHIEYISNPLRVWISSFHMPLFFIVSGLLMAIKDEPSRNFTESVKKKARGIIIPYLWFSLSYFIIDIFNVTILENIDMHTFIVDQISSLTFYGFSVLWFLPAIFLANVFFLFMKKHLPDKIMYFALIILAMIAYVISFGITKIYDANAGSLLITSLCDCVRVYLRALIATSLVGYAYYIHLFVKEKFPKILDTTNKKTNILRFFVGAIMLVINVVLSQINDGIDMHFMKLNNVLLFYIGAFLGCYGIILICMSIPSCKVITYYGKNSIIVMAAHVNYFILYAGLRIGMKVVQYVSHAKDYIMIGITMIVVFLLCIIVIEGINHLFPFVLGKRRTH